MRRFVKQILSRLGYEIRKRPRLLIDRPEVAVRLDLSYLLAHLLERNRNPYVVQVGAFDGVANDPLRDYIRTYRLSGLLIEPQIAAFERLAANYADYPAISLCHAAVSNQDGKRDLYRIDPATPGLPEWAAQAASFQKSMLLGLQNLIPDIDRRIIVEAVPCRSFDTLFRDHNVERVDVLQVDTEGFDFEILKLFPFHRLLPSLVRYEHIHLSPSDQNACLRMLIGLGYQLHVPDEAEDDYMDTVAYQPNSRPGKQGLQ